MINFYPGPSKIDDQVGRYLNEGLDSGLLAMNHRSPEFMELFEACTLVLKEKLGIPGDYEIAFTSSATECWEIIAQSLIREKSHHCFNGAFGEKWRTYTSRLGAETSASNYDVNDLPELEYPQEADVLCITQNETSNGTQVPVALLGQIARGEEDLIAIDATSSLGGIMLPIDRADIWFASVQKCFGLPSGMGVLICSPAAVARAKSVGEADHYNSLNFMLENARKHQTAYTPNILNIYLLYRLMTDRPIITEIDRTTRERYGQLLTLLQGSKSLAPLITNDQTRSHTVFSIISNRIAMDEIHGLAREKGIILGNGYGQWKNTTFRIANFPAMSQFEWDVLQNFIRDLDAIA